MISTPTTAPPGAPGQPRVLGLVFFTLFIDLIGFSIIFPLFPSMLIYYHELEGEAGLFGWFYGGLLQLSELAGPPDKHWGSMVLFGGILGSIYSLLQFLCAPLFGAISDRVGRRPVLLVALSGIALSYLLWVFAGSFWLLLLSRFLGGIMSANISTATAIVADITTQENRARGMAVIGIAFGVGFIFGPAIGGIAALVDLSALYPAAAAYGINPFSMPAAVACLLTVINIVSVTLRLPETRPLAQHDPERPQRTANPLRLLRKAPRPGVTQTNWSYFLFLLVFSGMEFSLVFLAVDRLNYTVLQNTYMFLFVGLVLSIVQGGYVRRQVERVGNKPMAVRGLILIIPGMALVGAAAQLRLSLPLYGGLFLLAAGAAMATPCLMALVSLYHPREEQGRALGIFRSLGALARALGPLVACFMYWRTGATTAYLLAAAFMLLPVLLAATLPRTQQQDP